MYLVFKVTLLQGCHTSSRHTYTYTKHQPIEEWKMNCCQTRAVTVVLVLECITHDTVSAHVLKTQITRNNSTPHTQHSTRHPTLTDTYANVSVISCKCQIVMLPPSLPPLRLYTMEGRGNSISRADIINLLTRCFIDQTASQSLMITVWRLGSYM